MRKPRSNRDEAQRIASIAQRFLQHNFFPPAFTHAITTYLMGEAALADVKQALHEAIQIGGAGIYLDFPLFALEGMSTGQMRRWMCLICTSSIFSSWPDTLMFFLSITASEI